MDLARMREEYETRGLWEEHVDADAIEQFRIWLQEAVDAGLHEPNAMVLSTVDSNGFPTSRNVLLKGLTTGFEFYTNYQSAKGHHIEENPGVALSFSWLELHRQVRIHGAAHQMSAAESDHYFQMRPRGAQVGAWASPQSEVLAGRGDLERRISEIEERFGEEIPRPPHWGGYRVIPSMVEFWQGQTNRLHDRLRYQRQPDHGWLIDRLAP